MAQYAGQAVDLQRVRPNTVPPTYQSTETTQELRFVLPFEDDNEGVPAIRFARLQDLLRSNNAGRFARKA